MPIALAIGIPYETFWHLTPNHLKAFYKAYKLKRRLVDEHLWYMGMYVASAMDSTVCNNSFWKGKHGSASHYVDKPIMSNDTNTKPSKSNEEIAVYEMKQRTKMLEKLGLPESPS